MTASQRLDVRAHCIGRCGWSASGDWPDVDSAAEAHTRTTRHPTATAAALATTAATTTTTTATGAKRP